jgi:hypothetical protein
VAGAGAHPAEQQEDDHFVLRSSSGRCFRLANT